jgi:hypothetical protein
VVPLTRAVLVPNALPPVLVEYHLIVEPVATKPATVPLLQNVCEAVPVGAAGTLIVAVTARRVADSQLLRVWLA